MSATLPGSSPMGTFCLCPAWGSRCRWSCGEREASCQYWWNQRSMSAEVPGQVMSRSRPSSTHWPRTAVAALEDQSAPHRLQRLLAGGLPGCPPLRDARARSPPTTRLPQRLRGVGADPVAGVGVAAGGPCDHRGVGLACRGSTRSRHRLDVEPHDRGGRPARLIVRDVEPRLLVADVAQRAEPGAAVERALGRRTLARSARADSCSRRTPRP